MKCTVNKLVSHLLCALRRLSILAWRRLAINGFFHDLLKIVEKATYGSRLCIFFCGQKYNIKIYAQLKLFYCRRFLSQSCKALRKVQVCPYETPFSVDYLQHFAI